MMVDTDVIIWYLRDNARSVEILDGLGAFEISVITYVELVQGMRNRHELRALKAALKFWNARIVFIDESISVKAMSLVEEYFFKSRPSTCGCVYRRYGCVFKPICLPAIAGITGLSPIFGCRSLLRSVMAQVT